LRSLSRVASSCLDEMQAALIQRARRMLAVQGDMADMVRLGAYRAGTDAAVDEALQLTPLIEDFLRQAKGDRCGFEDSFDRLEQALSGYHGP
jgi:flagellum-specific ATP synthase